MFVSQTDINFNWRTRSFIFMALRFSNTPNGLWIKLFIKSLFGLLNGYFYYAFFFWLFCIIKRCPLLTKISSKTESIYRDSFCPNVFDMLINCSHQPSFAYIFFSNSHFTYRARRDFNNMRPTPLCATKPNFCVRIALAKCIILVCRKIYSP